MNFRRWTTSFPTILPDAPECDASEGVQLGDEVTVNPLDEDSPATGSLIYHDDQQIVLRCVHQRVGEINVHFPRLGYRVWPGVR